MALLSEAKMKYVESENLWLFKVGVAYPTLSALNEAVLQQTSAGWRLHIPHTASTINNIFASRDKAIDFVNEFIMRYR
jgi:hypothetical protein